MLLSQRPDPLGETSHKPWSRCASVWNLWMIYELLSWAISLLFSFGHGLTFFWNTLVLHVSTFLFSPFFKYLGPSCVYFFNSPCPFNLERIAMNIMEFLFCGLDAQLPVWKLAKICGVYVILIMGIWNASLKKGHNNLTKLKEITSCICRRF